MYNPQIENLVFTAETLDEYPIYLHFHDIAKINTRDDIFYYDDGLHQPVACQYHTLRLLAHD